MNDRELLESAARTAKLDFEWADPLYGGRDTPMADGVIWNPLTDDGDAMRLAVQLDLTVQSLAENKTVEAWHHGSLAWEPWGHDKYAASRRAIVRAAAEIGKRVDAQPESVGREEG